MNKPFKPPGLNKPFKSPLLNKTANTIPTPTATSKPPSSSSSTSSEKSLESSSSSSSASESPSPSSSSESPSPSSSSTPSTPASSSGKKFISPKQNFKRPSSAASTPNSISYGASVKGDDDDPKTWRYFVVMFAKAGMKKHKTYEDGILVVKPRKYILKDVNGKSVIEKPVGNTLKDIKDGETIEIGNKELEIMKSFAEEEYSSGRIFLQFQNLKTSDTKATAAAAAAQKLASAKTRTEFKKHSSASSNAAGDSSSSSVAPALKTPDGAIILNKDHPPKDAKGNIIHDVYIDPFLAKNLRPHQIEGVQFMYDCVMENRDYSGCGCLLADEMGLGKTLQSICLLWTLLKRGPTGKPVAKKAVIVTPSSLVKNWAKEIKKWVSNERLTPLVVSSSTKQSAASIIDDFKRSYHKVLIVSYDLCRINEKEMKNVPCDLLICDEAHRLKNNGIKTVAVLNSLSTRRKILLTGTPVQNNLEEFYNIVEFLNPGLLGMYQGFKNLFADPISKSREPGATVAEKKLGATRSEELSKLISQFMLRRTSDVISKHLPPKTEIIVFCKMNSLQTALYKHFLKSKFVNSVLMGAKDKNDALSCINVLKKLLTHPNMIHKRLQKLEEEGHCVDEIDGIWIGCSKVFPDGYSHEKYSPELSGKLLLLESLLKEIKKKGDRIVVVSNYTSTLDEIQMICSFNNYKFFRLDGSTPSDKRLEYVDKFNTPDSPEFCFLLSSKAGGVGLNLIGANRLVLFDPDWNPSNDLQAMARIWREGQKKPVFIYRFMTTGTIEEKIFQRQIVKEGLSKTVMTQKNLNAAFSKDELRALFNLKENIRCETYAEEAEEKDNIETLSIDDPILSQSIEKSSDPKVVTFVKVRRHGKEDAIFAEQKLPEGGDEQEKAGAEEEEEEEEEDEDEDIKHSSDEEMEYEFDKQEVSKEDKEEEKDDEEEEEEKENGETEEEKEEKVEEEEEKLEKEDSSEAKQKKRRLIKKKSGDDDDDD